ncbi:hypothetical protein CAPTEDRAFT_133510, partial [Capitella teleta]
LQLLMVTDTSVRDFHGEDLIQQYIMTQIYMVDEMYHHPSLGIEINVGVSDIIILDERAKRNLVVQYDGRRTLDHFCLWADKFRSSGVSDFDVAVYLTRDDIGPAGQYYWYAPVTGMCASLRSCAVVRDDGISSAFVIAHELGHIFGMPHDGYDNHCSKEPDDGKIMAANVQSHFEHYYWTECSRASLEKYLDGLHCLHDQPAPSSWPLYERPFGVSWSLDEQCRQEFGEEFSQCRALPNMNLCDILWCSTPDKPLFCKTKRSPPLPGTSCARNKAMRYDSQWCMRGRCEARSTVAVDGGWSGWSEWGICSLTCGTGVQFRSRTCSNPMPEYGGSECEGAADERRLCNTQSCLLMTDFRAEQCEQQNEVNFFGGRRHHWKPREAEQDVCKLTCISEETGHVFISDSHVVDGTLCSYDNPHHICIKGECQTMGCDGEMGSNKTSDDCGVCGGDSSTCKHIKGTASRDIDSKEYHHLVLLPERARGIRISERNSSYLSHYLALRDPHTDKWYLNGGGTEGTSKHFVLHGTNFVYTNIDHEESLSALGPLLSAVEILVYSMSDSDPPTIDFEYTMSPNDAEQMVLMGRSPEHHALAESAADEQRFTWIQSGWQACSVSCGGGLQEDLLECLDTKQQMIVRGLCKTKKKPAPQHQACNEHACRYAFRWEAEDWTEACSQACGTHGVQRRHIRCMAYVSPTEEREVDPPYCDLHRMPLYQRPCNQFSCESVRWRTAPWSMVSHLHATLHLISLPLKCSPDGMRSRKVWCEAGGKPHAIDKAVPCPQADKPLNQESCQQGGHKTSLNQKN